LITPGRNGRGFPSSLDGAVTGNVRLVAGFDALDPRYRALTTGLPG
jgi:hypothetical protein